jgi:SAM-dependent methyltransferase
VSVYNEPLYYEIAFSFVDIPNQVDLFEKFVKKHSDIPVSRILDIGCGPSQQLREFAKRGYETIGLDKSPKMLIYLQGKAKEEGVNITTINADMVNFKLDKSVDFAYILMGTIGLLENKEDLLSHLDSVAQSLNSGGIYLIENLMINWPSSDFFASESWTMERDGISIESFHKVELADGLNQLLKGTLRLIVNDHGEKKVFEESPITRVFFPQEFITLVEMNNKFDFLGYFERSSTNPLSEALRDNITLLKRK